MESHHQITTAQWFKIQYPKYKDCFISIPNERSKKAGMSQGQFIGYLKKLKKMGMKTGVSDIFIAIPKGEYNGMWLELKDEGKSINDVTDAQKEHLTLMREMGYCATWAAGSDSAIAKIKKYMEL